MNIEDNINIICRQTDYNNEKAKEKLNLFNNDVEKVLNDYLGVKETPKKIEKSTNQMIYSQIRNLMDDSVKNYETLKQTAKN